MSMKFECQNFEGKTSNNMTCIINRSVFFCWEADIVGNTGGCFQTLIWKWR